MKALIVTLAALAATGPAFAQDVTVTPLAEARLRLEDVAQDGLPEDSTAVTVRVRAGVQAASGPWSALVETQGTMALVDHYDDGLHGAATRPTIADPQNIALYRAQLRYQGTGFAVTAGRQRIALDDERFIGNAAFRDNAQTFDAVRVEAAPIKGLKADLSYVRAVRTIWGIDGNGARQPGVGGDSVFANLGYATPIGTLTGFAYLVDQDEAEVQGFRLSSQTYGVRLAGVRELGNAVRLHYQASWATQSDYHRNPNRYRAGYWLADVGIEARGFTIGAGQEVLGADKGGALTSFQTPLGSVFKFQGWADKLTTTPPDGLRDRYATIGYAAKALGPVKGVTVQAAYHRFDSDRLTRHYGDEVNLLAGGKLGRTGFALRYARYSADRLFTDTRKLWVQFDWAL